MGLCEGRREERTGGMFLAAALNEMRVSRRTSSLLFVLARRPDDGYPDLARLVLLDLDSDGLRQCATALRRGCDHCGLDWGRGLVQRDPDCGIAESRRQPF